MAVISLAGGGILPALHQTDDIQVAASMIPAGHVSLTAPTYRIPTVGYGGNVVMKAKHRRKKRAAEAALSVRTTKPKVIRPA
jgi:hypothetical protein